MKGILAMFPRPFLIRLSLFFQPLLRWWFQGDRFEDPIDESSYRKFLPYGYRQLRPNALCPGTLSLERHRLLWLYLDRQTDFLTKKLCVLHVAPEQAFFQQFKTFSHWDYTTTDLYSPLADVKADLTDLAFADESFDLIFCNHVLEHIPEDAKALAELYRILRKGGTAILQVPLEEERITTLEDTSITHPKERSEAFGQYDHVRIYGQDYYQRVAAAGFQVQAVDLFPQLSQEEIQRYALQKERIPVGVK